MRVLVVASLTLVLAAACEPEITPPEIPPCGVNGACPKDYTCSPVDNMCYPVGEVPKTLITKAPPAVTNASVAIEFSSNGGKSYQCKVDAAPFAACTSPQSIAGAEGNHTFVVRAISIHGIPDPAPPSASWRTDLTPPTTTIVSGPPEATTSGDATFAFSASEPATFECSLDGAAFAGCPPMFTAVGDGVHVLAVRAVDAAGNVDPNPARYTWRVDRAGPSPTITSGPTEDAVTGRDVTFAFTTEPNGSDRCSLDGAAAVDCSTGQVSYSALAGGSHTFTVQGTDDVGNVGMPVARSWKVDAVGPTVTVTTPAAGAMTSPKVNAVFVASAASSSFECALDTAPFAGCTSPAALRNLAAGAHTFRVRATDPQHVTGGETAVTWTVDRTAPSVMILSPAAGSTNPSMLVVTWTADDATATFHCQLDGGAASSCTSPLMLMGLAGGPHSFILYATDAFDNSVTLPTLDFSVNDAPTISAIADQTTREDTPLTAIAFTIGDAQADPGELTVTASADDTRLLPEGALVVRGTGADRLLSLTPAANQSGTATVTITVSDGELSTTTSFDVTVSAVPDAPTMSAIGPQATAEGKPISLDFTVADVDTPVDALTVSATSADQALVPDQGLSLGGSGASRTLTITPAGLASGATDITVSVSDGTSTTATTFTLTVSFVDNPPTISTIDPQTTAEDTATGAIAFTVADPDTALASLTVTASSDTQAVLPDGNIVLGGAGGGRTIALTPAADQSGTATVTVSVSDGTSSTTTSFVVTVAPVDDPPTISDIGNQTINEDGTTGALAFTVGDVETPAASLTITGSSSNPALVPNGGIVLGGSGASRTVTVTPAANASGTATITVTVSDGSLTASDSFALTVNAVNDPPTISAIGNQTINEDGVAGPLGFTVADVETPAGSLTVSASSSNTTLVPNANLVLGGSGGARTITATPAANGSGTSTLTVTVSDGSASASTSFVLTVNPVNDPPTISSIANQTTGQGTPVGPISFTVGDIESGAAGLTLSGASSNTAVVSATGIVFGGSGSTRTVTVTPTQATGMATITVTVSDGSATASTSFTVTVNAAPTVLVSTSQTPYPAAGSTTVSSCGQSRCNAIIGSSVTIVATPSSGVGFSTWSGAGCPVAGSQTPTMTFAVPSAAVSCTANFNAPCYSSCTGACEGPVCWINERLVVDSSNAYWTRAPLDMNGNQLMYARLYKSPLTGGAGTKLADIDSAIAMTQTSASLYIIGEDGPFIVDKTTGAETPIFVGGRWGDDLEIDSSDLYWLETSSIYRTPLQPGSDWEPIIPHSDPNATAFTSDATNLYWMDSASPGGFRMRTAPKSTLAASDLSPVALAHSWGRMVKVRNDLVGLTSANTVAWFDVTTAVLSEVSSGVSGTSTLTAGSAGAYWAPLQTQAEAIHYQRGPGGTVSSFPLGPSSGYVKDLFLQSEILYILRPNDLARVVVP